MIDDQKIQNLFDLIRDHYPSRRKIALHEPFFDTLDEEAVANCVRSSFVSTIGPEVDRFEREIASFTGRERAVAVVNGTSGLHLALRAAGVENGDLVITQALSFIATANAITYCGATPIFVDIELGSLGLCPIALEEWLNQNTKLNDNGVTVFKATMQKIKACVPVNIFGHPCQIKEICAICDNWNIEVIEDCAESLGSFIGKNHTGHKSRFAIFSFNGNKIITTGGGGAVICSSKDYEPLKHLATTAKVYKKGIQAHDQIGFNYRLPNINCSLGLCQLGKLRNILDNKRILAEKYLEFGMEHGLNFVHEPKNCKSNYWLNTLVCNNNKELFEIQKLAADKNIDTRMAFRPINSFKPYRHCPSGDLVNTKGLSNRMLNVPSGPFLSGKSA